MALALVSAACSGGTGDPKGDSTDFGPAGDCPISHDVNDGGVLTQTLISTVLSAQWTNLDAPARAWFEGETSGAHGATPETTGGHALLLGTVADEQVTVQVEFDPDGDRRCSEPVVATTGPLPPSLPELVQSLHDADRAVDGSLVAPIITQSGSYVVVLDSLTRPVWVLQTDGTIFRARLSRDHTAVLYFSGAPGPGAIGAIHRTTLDGMTTTDTVATDVHTDFDELEDGSYVTLTWDVREFQDGDTTRRLLGDAVSVVNPDGDTTPVWNAFDHFTVDLTQEADCASPAEKSHTAHGRRRYLWAAPADVGISR